MEWKPVIWKSKISFVDDSFTTLFNKAPTRGGAPADKPKRGRPYKVPIIFLPIYLPLLLIAAAISIPWTRIHRLRQHRAEGKFAEQMNTAGRLMKWKDFELAIESGDGTIIGEYLSTKGPFRLWWTPEDIPALSPYRCDREHHMGWPEPEFQPFFQWCYAQFTNPQSGRAQLVRVPETERKELKRKLAGARFVSTCSFPSLRSGRDASR